MEERRSEVELSLMERVVQKNKKAHANGGMRSVRANDEFMLSISGRDSDLVEKLCTHGLCLIT